MKCTSKRIISIIMIFVLGMSMSACSSRDFSVSYDRKYDNSGIRIEVADNDLSATAFTTNLCVVAADKQLESSKVNLETVGSFGLFDVNNKEVLYSYDLFTEREPASLTKLMTALLAFEAIERGEISLSDELVATESAVKDIPRDAQACDLMAGESITMNQAMIALIMYSACDVANMIAEHVSGDIDVFVDEMNLRAEQLGATHTHFENTHGLSQENHYSTAYDIYLIFNELLKYPKFKEIVHMSKYITTYKAKDGTEKPLELYTTNLYFRGEATAPKGVTVVGGKTGSTNAAGSCIILSVNDTYGNDYIAIMMGAERRKTLYDEMTHLLSEL